MKRIFDHLAFVIVCLDDILVFSDSHTEYEKHLREVLALLRQYKLYAKLSKCAFFDREAQFLGHVVSEEGIKPDSDKITAIQQWPLPQWHGGCLDARPEASRILQLPHEQC